MYVAVLVPSSRKTIQSLAFFAGDNIYTDVHLDSDSEYIRICDKSAIKLLRNATMSFLMIGIAACLFACFPLYAYFANGELQLLIPMYVPFTDLETRNGIFINLLNQSLITFFGLNGNFGLDWITSMMQNTIWACGVAISYAIARLSNCIKKNEYQASRTIDRDFQNVLMQVQDYNR